MQLFCCIVFIITNVVLPILGSKQLLYLTNNIFEELYKNHDEDYNINTKDFEKKLK